MKTKFFSIDTLNTKIPALARFFVEQKSKNIREWHKRPDLAKPDIGKGGRSIVKGGVYVEKYAGAKCPLTFR